MNKGDSNKTQAFDPLIQTERIAFARDEMIACDACGRDNPPNRLACLYCAAGFNLVSGSLAALNVTSRRLEDWESGFNLILISSRKVEPEGISQIAEILSIETADVGAILAAAIPLPLTRVSTELEATILKDRLTALGMSCVVVTDVELNISQPFARLASIKFGEGELIFTTFNSASVVAIPATNVRLIVTGRIVHSRVDSIGKRGRGKTSTVDGIATVSDELLTDIYADGFPNGFRVHLVGFDFSALGAKKKLLASENMTGLVDRLVEFLPNVELVDSYNDARAALALPWPVEERDDSKGLQRIGFGKRQFASVSSTNNLKQFNRFSRLNRHLL